MKYLPLVLLLLLLFSCSSGSQKKLSDTEAKILLKVFDSLKDLENLEDVKASSDAFNYALKYMDDIWVPMYARMNVLAQNSVVSASDTKLENISSDQRIINRLRIQKSLIRYRDLRRSLVKLMKRKLDDRGIELMILHLDKDTAEAKEFLEGVSGETYGYNTRMWERWFFTRQMNSKRFNKQKVINIYRDCDPETRLKSLKFFLKVTSTKHVSASTTDDFKKKLDIRSPFLADLSQQAVTLKGVYKSQQVQIVKMIAVTVFLEALSDINSIHVNYASIGLKQLIIDAEESVLKHLHLTTDNNIRLRCIHILSDSNSNVVASKLLELSSIPQLKQSCLSSLGNFNLNKKGKMMLNLKVKSIIRSASKTDVKTLSLCYVILINNGQKQYFLDLLKLCPNNKFSVKFINDKGIQVYQWLQVRRVLKRFFDVKFPSNSQLIDTKDLSDSGKPSVRVISPSDDRSAEFSRYIHYHQLKLGHTNWLKWYNSNML